MRFKTLGLALVFAAGLAGSVAEAQQGNTITVPVSGLRNNIGDVRCGLYNSAATFPKDGQQFQGVVAPIVNQQATCTFDQRAARHLCRRPVPCSDRSDRMNKGCSASRWMATASRATRPRHGTAGLQCRGLCLCRRRASFPVTITYP